MSSPSTPQRTSSIRYPNGVVGAWNSMTGTPTIGRDAPVLVDGEYRTPTFDAAGTFRGYSIPNGEDLAAYPDIREKISRNATNKIEAKIKGEQIRQEDRSDDRFELLFREGQADRRSADQRYFAGLEADRVARQQEFTLRNRQISDALALGRGSLDLQGKAQLYNAQNNNELNRLTAEAQANNYKIAQGTLALREKELGAQKKLGILTAAMQLMSGRR